MESNQPNIALKEWASAIEALAAGHQILLMRKGGIVEETRHFELISHSFYLYPTYEHQRKELLKDAYHESIDATLAGWSPEDKQISLKLYAEVVHDLEVQDQETLDRLRDFHIWTDHFAEERLKWKKKQPLHVLVLRVYRLEPPVVIDIEPEYLGCKSWISLPGDVQPVSKKPIIEDKVFQAQAEAIRRAVESP